MYFDPVKNRAIDIGKDCIAFADWLKDLEHLHSCCRHPEGFPVFLEAGRLDMSDEYRAGDPYAVSDNIDSAFQKRRFHSTLHLLSKVADHQHQMRILDLGCGEGHLTEEIRKAFGQAEIHGLDYSLSAIIYAHTHYPDISFAVADGNFPPYTDGYFDVVVMNNIWEHVPDPLLLLKNVGRVLKKGGHIIISTPSRYRWGNLLRVVRGRPIAFMSKLHVTEYTVGQVKEQLRYAGYEVTAAYSTMIREYRMVLHWAKLVASAFLKMAGSQHILESTVFYLARKKQ